MVRFFPRSGALIFLAVLSCAKSGSVDDTGKAGQSGATAGQGATAGAGGAAGTGGGGPGGGGAVGGASGASASGGSGGASGGSAGSAGGVAGSGAGGTGGASGASGGASGGGGATGGAGGSTVRRTGMKSPGCGMSPMGAGTTSFTNHKISIPACAPCTLPNCPRNCIAPQFVPGGRDAQMTPNGETFVDRDFSIELPAGYQVDKAYAVYFGANGCGPAPPIMGVGFSAPGENDAIKVGLQQVSLPSVGMCFADGGIRCTPDITNVADCVNGPEIPYMLAVIDWVEKNFCVDLGSEFVGGGSSGAWEALLAGCAATDKIRGTYSVAGGLREHRWACNGPMATFMIVADPDTGNPVGPLTKIDTVEDTFGAAPARDEILARNGCVGKTTAPFDAKYPACVKYTGCPAAYPLVWCEFGAGSSHDNPTYNGVNYLNAVVPFFTSLPAPP
jgi:hypothetical protein